MSRVPKPRPALLLGLSAIFLFCTGQNGCAGAPETLTGRPNPRWAARCSIPSPGCVYLENHGDAPVTFARAGERPGAGTVVPARTGNVPGRRHVIVDPLREAASGFELRGASGAVAASAACSFDLATWHDRNPVVAWRGGALRCEGGR